MPPPRRSQLTAASVSIQPLDAVVGGVARHGATLDRIFFAASSVQSFPDDDTRARFRQRWLGRYLDADIRHAFVALASDGQAVGYLVGSLADAALDSRFADVAYVSAFAAVSGRYPAHVHINVDEAWRGLGIGERLIAAFAEHARAAGIAGLHIVTGVGLRNVGFYMANGFHEVARADVNGKMLVMLGLDLRSVATG